MFANKERNRSALRDSGAGENSIKAFLGAGSEFEGRIVFNENMRIDGMFKGEVSSEDLLVVGETAKIQAEVVVGTLIISGHFQGQIKANKVELRTPAHVKGDIQTPVISIEEGVVFDGEINMSRPVKQQSNQVVPLVAEK